MTEPELGALLSHNRNKFIEAGNQIIGGEVQLNPAYQGKNGLLVAIVRFEVSVILM